MTIKKIYQELRLMAKRKFLTQEVFKLLSEFPPEKLKEICATLMYNIVFLNPSDVKKLIKFQDDEKKFSKVLVKIKNKIEKDNIDGQIKQLQYVLCKMVGYLELKEKNEEIQEEIYDIILTDLLYPLCEWLKNKSKNNKIAESCFNILKNEIFTET